MVEPMVGVKDLDRGALRGRSWRCFHSEQAFIENKSVI